MKEYLNLVRYGLFRSFFIFILLSLASASIYAANPFTHIKSIFSRPHKNEQAELMLPNWIIHGAISIQRQGEKPILANYKWQEAGLGRYRIDISSSLNVVHLIIMGQKDHVRLWRSNKLYEQATTPEELMQQAVGWWLPVSNLQYWILGKIAPQTAEEFNYDDMGHLINLFQDDWRITFSAYKTEQGIDLPHEIQLFRPEIQVKMIIKNWQIY